MIVEQGEDMQEAESVEESEQFMWFRISGLYLFIKSLHYKNLASHMTVGMKLQNKSDKYLGAYNLG